MSGRKEVQIGSNDFILDRATSHVTKKLSPPCRFTTSDRWWVMAKRKKDPDYYSASDFEPPASTKTPAVSSRRKRRSTAAAATRKSRSSTDTDELLDTYATPPHSPSRHMISSSEPMRASLLEWYAGVHEARGMPWRKPFDPSLNADARAQRAYEVRFLLVSFVVGCSFKLFFFSG
jgi:hypothetical protein